MFFRLLLTLFLQTIFYSHHIIYCNTIMVHSSSPEINDENIICTLQAMELSCNENETVAISFASSISTDNLLLQRLSERNSWSFLLLDIWKPLDTSLIFWRKINNFVVVISTLKELSEMLNRFKVIDYWNSRAKFTIVVPESLNSNRSYFIENTFEYLWSENIYNAILLIPEEINRKSIIDAYASFPFTKTSCTYTVRKINACISGRFVNSTKLFPKKIPANLNSCPIRVRPVIGLPYVSAPKINLEFKNGIDIDIIDAIAQIANFSIVYSLSNVSYDWGLINNRTDGTGLMWSLLKGEVDIGMNGLMATNERFKYLDISRFYHIEKLSWYVPHAKKRTYSSAIVMGLNIGNALTYLLSYLIFGLLLWLLSHTSNVENFYKHLSNCLLNCYVITLGMSIKTKPKSTIVRLHLLCWIISFTFFNIIYQTIFISLLTQPSYDKQITTVQDILDKKMKMYLFPSFMQFFEKTGKGTLSLMQHKHDCVDLKECVDRVANQSDSVMFMYQTYIEHFSNLYLTADSPLLYRLDDNTVIFPVTFIMKKGFILKDRIDKLIVRLSASGILNYWLTQKAHTWTNNSLTSECQNCLSMTHLRPAMYCFLIGIGVSVTIFVCEHLIYKKAQKRK